MAYISENNTRRVTDGLTLGLEQGLETWHLALGFLILYFLSTLHKFWFVPRRRLTFRVIDKSLAVNSGNAAKFKNCTTMRGKDLNLPGVYPLNIHSFTFKKIFE